MADSLPTGALTPNRPDVIDETFDGEAVLVNLQSGCYFALSPAATLLWNLVLDGRSATALAASVDADAAVVERFVAELLEEGLLVEGGADAGAATEAIAIPGEPTFQKFTDMQDLMALDPIHDIDLDADGWPVIPSA